MQETVKLALCRSDLLLLQCFQSNKKKKQKQKQTNKLRPENLFCVFLRSEYFPITKIC